MFHDVPSAFEKVALGHNHDRNGSLVVNISQPICLAHEHTFDPKDSKGFKRMWVSSAQSPPIRCRRSKKIASFDTTGFQYELDRLITQQQSILRKQDSVNTRCFHRTIVIH
eukprot:m.1190862 g.1190862  ORF g.1190862 m.1190862 type:complete len:111 (+) comp24556_c1_seq25:2284-2616(+)